MFEIVMNVESFLTDLSFGRHGVVQTFTVWYIPYVGGPYDRDSGGVVSPSGSTVLI